MTTSEQIGPSTIRWRPTISKHNGSPIPLNAFLSTEYSHVSALIGCSSFFPGSSGGKPTDGLPSDIVIHNPLADHPLPRSWLPGAEEWVANIIEDGVIAFEKIG